MRAAVFFGPRDVRVDDVPDPIVRDPTDAVVRVTHACICGSDLWFYNGVDPYEPGSRVGHEWMGIVEQVGRDVRGVRRGDRVIAPFAFSDGTCEFCREHLPTSCVHGDVWGKTNDGGQGEALRVPYADGTLVRLPRDLDAKLARAILPLTDVMGTGHHGAHLAGVRAGATVAIVGDGAVALCAVLAARRLGAERIFVLGHHQPRLELAARFGATDLIAKHGTEAPREAVERNRGKISSVIECVGNQESFDAAMAMVRPGGTVGFVGVPHLNRMDLRPPFMDNVSLRAGIAPVRVYLDELLSDVLKGKLDPSPVLDRTIPLEEIGAGYAAMARREAIKVMVEVRQAS
jgi:threonine dehydrogenase-like Zn-dependent dehydrogenase